MSKAKEKSIKMVIKIIVILMIITSYAFSKTGWNGEVTTHYSRISQLVYTDSNRLFTFVLPVANFGYNGTNYDRTILTQIPFFFVYNLIGEEEMLKYPKTVKETLFFTCLYVPAIVIANWSMLSNMDMDLRLWKLGFLTLGDRNFVSDFDKNANVNFYLGYKFKTENSIYSLGSIMNSQHKFDDIVISYGHYF